MAWRWLLESTIIATHDAQLAIHGGGSGLRDQGLLESALARAQNQAAYGTPSVFDLAAAYAFGICRNHPFVDGNKRTGLLAAYIFLSINGYRLAAPETEAVLMTVALAEGSIGEAEYSTWLQSNSRPK